MATSFPNTATAPLDLASEPEALLSTADVHGEVLQLFDAAAPAIRRYVRACGVPAAQCEDVVQETFVALFHHLRRGGARYNLRGWLMQVSYRLSLKERQRLTRRLRVETPWAPDAVDLAIDPAEGPEASVVTTRDQHRLRRVFEALPERQRQCLALRAEGLRYREIAKTLGLSLGAVAKSLTLAVTRLSNAVKD